MAAAAGGEQVKRNMPTRVLCWSALRSCGKYSYAIYVFHQLINKLLGEPWMAARFGSHPPAHTVYLYSVTIGLISFGAAFLSYHLLEKRFLALRYLFVPRMPRPGIAEIRSP